MRRLPLAALTLALLAAPAAAQASETDRVLAVPGDPYKPEWGAAIQALLLEWADADGSGQIDTAAEVDGVSCGAWLGMQDAVRGGVREIYGFDPAYGYVGSALGFDESVRGDAYGSASLCLENATLTVGEIQAVPNGGSPQWKAAVGEILRTNYGRPPSGIRADGAVAIECDVWRAVELAYRRGGSSEFWVDYGFAPGLIWNASELGFDESAREAAFADLSACRYLVGDVDPLTVLASVAGGADASGGPSATSSQRLDGVLDEGDPTLRSGEYVETWVVYAAAGQTVTAEVYSAEFDPYVILKSPSGQQVENDDWAGSTSVARVDVEDAEEGTWEVLATSYRPSTTGAYEVTVSSLTPSTEPPPVSAASLAGTVWAEACSGSTPARSYLRLDADGGFAWSEISPSDVALDGGDAWSVAGDVLTVSWNDGYATTRYTLDGTNSLAGESTKTCGSAARLVRVGG